MTAPTTSSSGFRGDIEGLRAVAVLAVLAYHAELGPFHGGYIGVDVFFVVSGYLITSLLMRDLLLSGAKALPSFWARRARRLLPGSFVVVVTTLLVGRLVLDPLAQRDLMRDALAVTTFTVNIVFARRQSDYLTSQLDPSPLLHFWSLALEEQFYIVWPALLLAATRIRRRFRWFPAAMIAVLLVGSLTLCIRLTTNHQPQAFFLLPTRAWELFAGAALAVASTTLDRIPAAVRAGTGWLGLVAVVVVALRFTELTQFPGLAAILPVSATVLVLAAGGCRYGPALLLDVRPLTWLGTRSYGTYLWHWPILVLAAAEFGPLDAARRAGAVVAAITLAALSYRFIENPARRSVWLSAKNRRSLALGATLGVTAAFMAAVMLVVSPSLTGNGVAASLKLVVPSTTVATTPPRPLAKATAAKPSATPASTPASTPTSMPTSSGVSVPTTVPTTTAAPSDVTLAAIVEANAAKLQESAITEIVPSNLTPSLGKARSDKPQIYADGCILNNGQVTKQDCIYGDTGSSVTVVLFGDSHAAQWFPALEQMAHRNRWRLDVRTKKGCPTADIPIADRARGPECGPWRRQVIADLADEHPALVIMSAYRYKTTRSAVGSSPDDVWRNGLQTTLDELRPLAANVLVLGDTPTPMNDVPGCVASHLRHVSACMNSRSSAVKPGRLTVELDVAVAHDARFVPTSDWLCTPTDCPVVIGNLLVYRDNSHITTASSLWLEPYLEAAVRPLING